MQPEEADSLNDIVEKCLEEELADRPRRRQEYERTRYIGADHEDQIQEQIKRRKADRSSPQRNNENVNEFRNDFHQVINQLGSYFSNLNMRIGTGPGQVSRPAGFRIHR